MRRTLATAPGVRLLHSGSRARKMPTADGPMHVKLKWSDGSEGPYVPATESLATSLIEFLGVARPDRWLVELPASITTDNQEFHDLLSPIGLGTAWIDGLELIPIRDVLTESRNAPLDELLAQHLVKSWFQVEQQDYVKIGDRVMAIDFAGGLSTGVWEGWADLGHALLDHAGLSAILSTVPPTTRDVIRTRFDAIDGAVLWDLFEALPKDWSKPDERERVQAELLRTKSSIRALVNG